MTHLRGAVPLLAAAVILTYAAFLRLDALTMKFGPVDRPGWLHALQVGVGERGPALRPAAFAWASEPDYPHADGPPTRYISDPYTYLGFARAMPSFYAAHYREPLFVLATRLWLRALDDQDVAVSFASMTFSIAAVAIVIALGWYAFSPWIGLGAGLLMTIEYELVSWGISGWRDEAFVAVVPLWALALLRAMRAPSPAAAAALGSVGGLAMLVRVTSFTFVVPGLLLLAGSGGQRWRPPVRAAAIAALVVVAVSGPYFVNCWRVFGDPLYAINYHAGVYAAVERREAPVDSAAGYVGSAALARPVATADTIAAGLSTYPFANKWNGFDIWLPGLGRALMWTALAGLVCLTASSTGWVLLVVLVTSLVPFAVTWRLLADWRFTEHAYAFYLVAACVAIDRVVRLALWMWRAGAPPPVRWRAVVVPAVVVVFGAAAWWAGARFLPVLIFEEALASGDLAVIESGRRDGAFFAGGWSPAEPLGAITVRTSEGFPSVMRIPLPEPGDYDLRLRLDPLGPAGGQAGGVLRVFANGQAIGQAPLDFDPERVGSYEFHWPRAATHAGVNRLEFLLDTGLARTGMSAETVPTSFRFWYAMVRRAGQD